MPLLFDYIVIGSGASGCACARRLKDAFPEKQILVVEAGSSLAELDPALAKRVLSPQSWTGLFAHPTIDYDIMTPPQPGLDNRRVAFAQGKVVGGSTAINAGMYVCGLEEDFKIWHEAARSEEWSFAKLRSKFPHLLTDATTKMEVTAEASRKSPLAREFVKAASGTIENCPMVESYNHMCAGGVGFTEYLFRSDSAKRITAFDHFIGEKRAIFNHKDEDVVLCPTETGIHVWTNCRVVNIEFGSDLKATGVRLWDTSLTNNKCESGAFRWLKGFSRELHPTCVKDGHARRVGLLPGGEIVCCAGAIFTPQLLMLSGVGPESELQKHNINIVARNEYVGTNFHDHMLCGLYLWNSKKLTGRTNPYTNGQDAVAFVKVPAAEEKQALETAEIVCVDGSSAFRHVIPSIVVERVTNLPFLRHHVSEAAFEWLHFFFMFLFHILLFPLRPLFSYLTCRLVILFCIQGRPHSRGNIRLRSNDFRDFPVVNPNYMGDPRDVEAVCSTLKVASRIASAMKLKLLFPLSRWLHASDPASLRWYVRDSTVSSWHPCGSVALGTALDNKLCVRGVKGVRVADASAFPVVVSGNTQAACYLMGTMAADLIKADDAAVASKLL
jgi:choline dehydrogenase